MPEPLDNWGNCLSDQGRRKAGESAARLFAQARVKYSSAFALSKNADDVVQNYINLLIDAKYCATREEALLVVQVETAALALNPP